MGNKRELGPVGGPRVAAVVEGGTSAVEGTLEVVCGCAVKEAAF